MKERGLERTRENFINTHYWGEVPDPWTIEHEEDVPEDLRDFSKCE